MFPLKKAICYSGYRNAQSPKTQSFPSDQEVLEDLVFLSTFVSYIRMYDTSYHAHQVLRLIQDHHIDLKVMLGVEPLGEIDNPNCHFGGRQSKEDILAHKKSNLKQLDDLLSLSETYKPYVLALSVGNENTSDWHPHLISEESLISHVHYLKRHTDLLITFCEGAYFWHQNKKLANVVDFISIHSYPQWQKKGLIESIELTKRDYEKTVELFDKPVIFTEYGWTTSATEVMNVDDAHEENQALYLEAISQWSNEHHVQMFLFEAFDEPWKGSSNPLEPEKHWGIFTKDRQPKLWQKKKPTFGL
jgi:exo-beta-1,3-glucanase (GH17 family)